MFVTKLEFMLRQCRLQTRSCRTVLSIWWGKI